MVFKHKKEPRLILSTSALYRTVPFPERASLPEHYLFEHRERVRVFDRIVGEELPALLKSLHRIVVLFDVVVELTILKERLLRVRLISTEDRVRSIRGSLPELSQCGINRF